MMKNDKKPFPLLSIAESSMMTTLGAMHEAETSADE